MRPAVFQSVLRWSIAVVAFTILSGINGCLTIQDELAVKPEVEYHEQR